MSFFDKIAPALSKLAAQAIGNAAGGFTYSMGANVADRLVTKYFPEEDESTSEEEATPEDKKAEQKKNP